MTLDIPTPALIGADQYPVALRQAIVALAIEEWEAFGRPVIDYRAVDQPLTKLARLENDPAVFDRMVRYWSVLGPFWHAFVDEQTALRDVGRTDIWAREPWSAAFISWLMKAAGVSRADFQFSASHWRYIDYAMQTDRELGERALYQPLDADAVVPQPGDLICGDRSKEDKPRLLRISDRAAEAGEKRKLHCDLVVGRTKDAVLAIGGNLSSSVALCHYPAHPDGRLVTDRALRRDHRTLFGLLRCRLRGAATPLLL
jgi:hypothetical protein